MLIAKKMRHLLQTTYQLQRKWFLSVNGPPKGFKTKDAKMQKIPNYHGNSGSLNSAFVGVRRLRLTEGKNRT